MTKTSRRNLHLGSMAEAFEQQQTGPSWRDAIFWGRLEHVLTHEVQLRRTRKIDRIRKKAKLRHNA